MYIQIERRIRMGVADGTLQPGDHLPSVRDSGLGPAQLAPAELRTDRGPAGVKSPTAEIVMVERLRALDLALRLARPWAPKTWQTYRERVHLDHSQPAVLTLSREPVGE